jgi:hypothetical protein
LSDDSENSNSRRAETVEGAEGKIKGDGTTLGHRAKISWSAHWLEDGWRHRPKDIEVPRLGETSTLAGLFAAPWIVLLCSSIDRYIDADEPG